MLCSMLVKAYNSRSSYGNKVSRVEWTRYFCILFSVSYKVPIPTTLSIYMHDLRHALVPICSISDVKCILCRESSFIFEHRNFQSTYVLRRRGRTRRRNISTNISYLKDNSWPLLVAVPLRGSQTKFNEFKKYFLS